MVYDSKLSQFNMSFYIIPNSWKNIKIEPGQVYMLVDALGDCCLNRSLPFIATENEISKLNSK